MEKIKEILIGTNNEGKYRELCDLLPNNIKKYSPKEFKLVTPKETGKTFEENAMIKASYFSKKTNLLCLSDDSGLEIYFLNGEPGIYSSRWGGKKKNFNVAINKIFKAIKEKERSWKNNNKARFVCCLSLFWPDGKTCLSKGIVNGTILNKKKGVNGFGYDPIFVPNGHKLTFGEMKNDMKISIDHRYQAYLLIKNIFN